MNNIFTFKIGGEAGQGQQVAGLIFAKAYTRGGQYSFNYSEYPSRIRGGYVAHQVSISETPLFGAWQKINLLIALSKETIDLSIKDLTKDAIILYDSDKFKLEKIKNFKSYPMPLATLAKEAGVKPLAENIIALGITTALLNYKLEALEEVISDIFKVKGKEVVEMNFKAAKFGYDYAKKNFQPDKFPYNLKFKKAVKDKILVTANDTVALGAIACGCKFLASYPMTPASSILHNLAAWAEKVGIIVKQPEDEISAIHMAIGANFAGVRAMTATSGGGFALMTEGLALAGITETPVVIVESQRPGPATGLPTWTEQGDLSYLAHAGHGEFIRIILAPGDAKEAYYLTPWAFNLAEKYQVPVFLLLDKYLSEATMSVKNLDISNFKIERGEILTEEKLAKMKEYKRYLLTKSGVSPRALPGRPGGVHLANSDEHDEFGFSIEGYQAVMRKKQMNKRWAKLPAILKELPAPRLFGPQKTKTTLMGWGSVKGPVLEALKVLNDVNYIQVVAPWPLATESLKKILKGVKKLVVIENNKTGQFAQILKQAGIKFDATLNKYDGHQFWPEEIIEKLKI